MQAPDYDSREESRLNPEVHGIRAANRWLRVAVVSFVLAVAFGVHMAASHDFRLIPVHAHLNLLGWVSMALIGLVYRAFPAAANSRIAKVQFWLHNIMLPPLMAGVGYLRLTGDEKIEPVLAICSIAILVSAVLFAFNVLRQPK